MGWHQRLLWIAVILSIAVAVVAAGGDSTTTEGECLAADATCVGNENIVVGSNDTVTDEEELDEAEHKCQDNHKQCGYWQSVGECKDNKEFMETRCPRSCRVCPDQIEEDLERGADMGVPQKLWSNKFNVDEDQTEETILAAREYMKNMDLHEEVKTNCRNYEKMCAVWAVHGECDANPDYMKYHCGPVCNTCDIFTVEGRCKIDPDAIPIWKEGDLDAMFVKLTSEPYKSMYDVEILSIDPWVITMENVISDEEADRFIELGAIKGYKRSMNVGDRKADGSFAEVVSDHRTSHNAWCHKECQNDTTVIGVKDRLSEMTGVPANNAEFIQLLRYEEGQFYKRHHDYIAHNVKRQQGVRILTVFLYLNDVEEGGGTHFNLLNITVSPKKGRALLWPSVLNDNPHQSDWRMYHEALPVIAGIKYGANLWYHQFDYEIPSQNGCVL